MMRWRRAVLLVATFILAYLALAGAWAWTVFDEALAARPVPDTTPLSAR